MKINADILNQLVTIDGTTRSVVGLMPEYLGIESAEFDMNTSTGIVSYQSRSRQPVRITTITALQTAIAKWHDARPSHASVWLDIKAKRTALKSGGVMVGSNWFFTDTDSIGQYSIMLAAVAVNSLPNSYVFAKEWKTMTGAMVPMTVDLLKVIVGTGMHNEVFNFANAERHRGLLMLSANPSDYDFSNGWTKAFP